MDKVSMAKHILHVMVGTKGQMTKMAPILRELDKRKIPYNFIRTGQHAGIIDQMIATYQLRSPDFFITRRKKDLGSIAQCIFWVIHSVFSGLLHRRQMWQGKKGVVLIHGDTESTLVSVALARLSGIKIGHVEAGLRSFNLLDPFPEEIIRRITSFFSDYMFAPGEWASNNLKKEGKKGKVINTQFNTIADTIQYVLQSRPTMEIPSGKYVVFAFHRKETLYVKKTLQKAIECLERIAREHKVIFILHKNTEYTLKKGGHLDRLKQNNNISFKQYYDHVSFMYVIKNCTFAVSDGGSLQEETYFLNKPYLILRNRTERLEGLNETAFISNLDSEKINYFLANYNRFKRPDLEEFISPSKIIIDEALRIVDSMNETKQ